MKFTTFTLTLALLFEQVSKAHGYYDTLNVLGLNLPLMIAGLSGGFIKWSGEKNAGGGQMVLRMLTGMIVGNYFGAWVSDITPLPLFVSGCTTGFLGILIVKFAQDKLFHKVIVKENEPTAK